jgi:hypothetical protein
MLSNLKSLFDILKAFFSSSTLKKNNVEKLKKNNKAEGKKYLDNNENIKLTNVIHSCDKNIKFDYSENDTDDVVQIKKNGFVKISNLNFEFNYDNINKILDDKNLSVYDTIGVSSVIDASYHFPELNKILESERINNICKSYLGIDAKVNHIRVERLEPNLCREDVSGLYHHDQIGNRLKILVLLDDVQKDGRCTSYAKRTHKIKWTNYDYDQSRYDTKIIEKEFEICKFFGNRGDIFLFDTNGLHKRDEKKEKPKRAVAFIDVANHDKCVAIKKLLPDKVPHPFPIGYYREQYFNKDIKIEKTLLNANKIKLKNDLYFYESD